MLEAGGQVGVVPVAVSRGGNSRHFAAAAQTDAWGGSVLSLML